MFYEEIRRQAQAAPRAALPAVTSTLWKAFGEGHLSEAEAEALSGLIEARQLPERPAGLSERPAGGTRSCVGSRPRTDASMARRRRWAASGRLPPAIAARFTLAEQAVLSLIAAETAKRGDCRLTVGHIAAVAGVSETTVRTAIREARKLSMVTVEERRLARFRNDTNVVCIVSREWRAWLQLARTAERLTVGQTGGGCRSPQGTNTPVPYPVNSEGWKRQKGCRGVEASSADKARSEPCRYDGPGRAIR
ncbi:hypothetical protein AFCDBAGC_1289 [Methylobacterium cerastii]|uniref:Helix-turn-helix domain-containing protein n=1 Tax=Methylobacterium cerastii TaxID=932741 RepID=A0ABQ4QDZ6_9HYPH|nr:helix-turn-helix domain-containing protein [Methylobacterium cerastii]GJD43437.1 hypothetical protein AFCDBAGC_1289 [Methylobacterium cerastii]